MGWRLFRVAIMVHEELVKCKSTMVVASVVGYKLTLLLRLQAVTMEFSRKLRRLAVSDQIVKMAGVAGYAQSVLVPELAMRLVKEDMGVSNEKARAILRESIALGEKMHPAQNDVVPVPVDEDTI